MSGKLVRTHHQPAIPTDLTLHEAVHRGVLAFNEFPEDAQPPHLERMRLILETPTLQAHRCSGTTSGAPLSRTTLRAASDWRSTTCCRAPPEASLRDLLDAAMEALGRYLQA